MVASIDSAPQSRTASLDEMRRQIDTKLAALDLKTTSGSGDLVIDCSSSSSTDKLKAGRASWHLEQIVPLFNHFDQIPEMLGKIVRVESRVVRLREMKRNYFAHLYMRSFDELQCYVPKSLENSGELNESCTVIFVGELVGLTGKHFAPGNVELSVKYVKVIGQSPAGGVSTVVATDSNKDLLFNKRHLSLRYPCYGIWIFAIDTVAQAFRDFFRQRKMIEVFPPTITKSKSEGGSEVFTINYFDTKAYLTQSSQMYLEALVPLGDCYCFLPSFRAEPSQTSRHLAEYTHIEAEMQFMNLVQLMDFIEALIVHVDQTVRSSGLLDRIKTNNPTGEIHELGDGPFVRMTYREYVDKLREYGITEAETGRFYDHDEDIPSLPEKLFINKINRPTFIYHIPRQLKAFYMKPADDDETLADCCDLLLPGIGEVFGASVRMHDLASLQKSHLKVAGLDKPNLTEEEEAEGKEILKSLEFYEDLRKFGCHYTSGFGAGLSRVLHFYGCTDIKFATPFPRTISRLEP